MQICTPAHMHLQKQIWTCFGHWEATCAHACSFHWSTPPDLSFCRSLFLHRPLTASFPHYIVLVFSFSLCFLFCLPSILPSFLSYFIYLLLFDCWSLFHSLFIFISFICLIYLFHWFVRSFVSSFFRLFVVSIFLSFAFSIFLVFYISKVLSLCFLFLSISLFPFLSLHLLISFSPSICSLVLASCCSVFLSFSHLILLII